LDAYDFDGTSGQSALLPRLKFDWKFPVVSAASIRDSKYSLRCFPLHDPRSDLAHRAD
jgi:hypothetical protein